MKKIIKLVMVFCVLSTIGAGENSFAILDPEYPYSVASSNPSFIKLVNSNDDTKTCYFYTSSSTDKNCDTSLGKYDASTYTITLSDDGEYDLLEINNIDKVTVVAADSVNMISLDGGIRSDGDIDIAFGAAQLNIGNLEAKNLTILNGVLKIDQLNLDSTGGNFVIKNGDIEITEKSSEYKTYTVYGNFEMDGGKLTSTGFVMNSFSMKGGEITIESNGLHGIYVNDGDFTLDGGTIEIIDKKTDRDGWGIYMKGSKDKGSVFAMNSGALTIDGFSWGINSDYGKINFNGGVTILKNCTTHFAWILSAANPETDIAFGDGMGIKENNIYVFYNDNTTGIAAAKNSTGEVATIAKGYNYKRYNGWLSSDNDYDWTWFTEWAKNEGWNDGTTENKKAYVSCLLDNGFKIYNLDDYEAYHGMLADKTKNKTLTDDEIRIKEVCASAAKTNEGLVLEGGGQVSNNGEGVPTTPNTGIFANEKELVIVTSIVIPTICIGGYMCILVRKRSGHKVHFKKR